MVRVVGINDVASGGRRNDGHVTHIGGDAAESNLIDRNAAGTGARAGGGLYADAERELQIIAKKFVVFPGDNFIVARGLHELLRVGDEWKSRDLKNIGAESGDALADVPVHAIDEGDDDNQCGDGQNNAEQRQERAHLVLAQRVQREQRGFFELLKCFHDRI